MKVYRLLTRMTAVTAAMMMAAGTSALAHSELLVRMNAIKGPVPEIVEFTGHEPVVENGVVLVPARYLADVSGMFASWDQPSQTATITLYSCAWGENSVERYAASMMDSVDTYGLELEPYNITAEFKLGDCEAVLKYNYKDADGDIVSMGKTIEADAAAELVNDGTLMIPLETTMEMFGLDFSWSIDGAEAEVSIPDYIAAPSDMSFMADKNAEAPKVDVVVPEQNMQTVSVDTTADAPVNADPSIGKYLGRFKITHYCPCEICNGGWGGHTAWAGEVIPGQTIAVDPNVIPKLSWVYIDGYGYRRAEDSGGAIKENKIDVAVATHDEAISKGVVYKDVYLVEE